MKRPGEKKDPITIKTREPGPVSSRGFERLRNRPGLSSVDEVAQILHLPVSPEGQAAAVEHEQSGRPQTPEVAVHNLPARTAEPAESGRPPLPEADGPRVNVDGSQPPNSESADGKPATFEKVAVHISEERTATKKDRHRGNKARYDNRIDPGILTEIKKFCAGEGIDQQEFAELSAVHYMRSVAGHRKGKVDGLPSHDDQPRSMMLFKTRSFIIDLYLQYNPDNRWKARDDRAAEGFNNADPRLVELGILHTLLRTERKRIHSFAYFAPEIEDAVAVPMASETVDMMLRRRREQYERLLAGRGSQAGIS